MLKKVLKCVSVCSLALLMTLSPRLVIAETTSNTSIDESSHFGFTVIINQVRGSECCSAGGVSELEKQLALTTSLKFPTTFVVRYDVLQNVAMRIALADAVKQHPDLVQIGGFLEITPKLAADSGVKYTGTSDNWYEAQHAYFIGYSPEDRRKLIDQYMKKYQEVFQTTPRLTTAWMIDADSLKYFHEKYHVVAHEITREQWGVDSYTLYGGPVHYPYYPTEKWAMIPAENQTSSTMPLILRQTIADPVMNYGDQSSSFTSQPNDYARGSRGIEYFSKLFQQAHSQPTESYTFALLGLENSMPEKDQIEFTRQLEVVKNWRGSSDQNKIIFASDFAKWRAEHSQGNSLLTAVRGYAKENEGNAAVTVTTGKYQARLRVDGSTIRLTDVRVYSPDFEDPYVASTAQRQGFWVIPFLIDGSRFWQGASPEVLQQSTNDRLTDRPNGKGKPTGITLRLPDKFQVKKLSARREGEQIIVYVSNDLQEVPIARFSVNSFELQSPENQLKSSYLHIDSALQINDSELQWVDKNKNVLWGVTLENKANNWKQFSPFVRDASALSEERETKYPLLFPEVRQRPLSKENSKLFVNNRYAVAGRNPIRLVFFPRDAGDYPIQLEKAVEISSTPEVSYMKQEQPHGSNGMIFIDYVQPTPGRFLAKVQYGDDVWRETVYFVPNCKSEWKYCLAHPQQTWWFVRSFIEEKIHDFKGKQQEKELLGEE